MIQRMGATVRPITGRVRRLRRNGTDAENRLWYFLRNRQLDGTKFVRQLPIGPYVADFVCRDRALIVELDGGQHNGSVSDRMRTARLNAEGYSVLRFWNNEVLQNTAGVREAIRLTLAGTPSPDWCFAPADLSLTGRGTRGENAAAGAKAAIAARGATVIPLPVGERSAEGRVRGS